MKKYNVSLALKVYSNFEIKINAKTKEEALKIALEKYSNGEYDENNIAEPDWCNSKLDIENNNNLNNGIHIEEIE
ncbi:MAG: hypothetical protein ABIA02_01245 [Candidatus Falkowbacteria bacterium]